MDLFITRLPLKENVTTNQIWDIINAWLTQSPHYGIETINYNMEEDYTQDTSSHTRLFIQNQTINDSTIFACRFENNEDSTIWKTDCIFNGKDYTLCIRLSCSLKDYSTSLPKIHKPHIVKLLFESNLIKNTDPFPITDTPIIITDADLETCSKIMKGDGATYLPVVYISYNAVQSGHYPVDCNSLAIKLSGQAHVLIEPNKEFALKLREETCGLNAYNGYIGIYFPKTTYREVISYNDYFDNGKLNKFALEKDIRLMTQQAMINHFEIEDWSWERLLLEIHKKKASIQTQKVIDSSKELKEYMDQFDAENNHLKEQIKSLRHQLESKNAQLEQFKRSNDRIAEIVIKRTEGSEFFFDEYKNFIIHVLSLSKDKIPKDTRPYELLTDILSNNNISYDEKKFQKDLLGALQDKSLDKRRKKLESLGFTVEKGSHDKIYFHDPKYSFTLANSPSDYRGSNNTLSDILKQIDIFRKFF